MCENIIYVCLCVYLCIPVTRVTNGWRKVVFHKYCSLTLKVVHCFGISFWGKINQRWRSFDTKIQSEQGVC